MNFRDIVTTLRRDSLCIRRDRRSLIFMVLLPLILIPSVLILLTGLTKESVERLQGQAAQVLLITDPTQENSIAQWLTADDEQREALFKAQSDNDALLVFMKVSLLGNNAELADYINPFPDQIAPGQDDQKTDWGITWLSLSTLLAENGDISSININALNTVALINHVKNEEMSEGATLSESDRRILAAFIENDLVDAVVVVPADWLSKLNMLEPAPYSVYYAETSDQSRSASRRVQAYFNAVNAAVSAQNLADQNITPALYELAEVDEINVGEAYNIISRILPYFIIFSCFVGGLAPAVDLFAGEKERQTLETLFLVPASRSDIMIGKFVLVFFACLLAGVLCMISLSISLDRLLAGESATLMQFSPTYFAWSFVLLLPLSAVFAVMMMSLSLIARNQKQAQTFMMPLNFLIIIPAFYSLIPGTELTSEIARVPVVNVSLAIRDIWSGVIDFQLIGQIMLWTFFLLLITLMITRYLIGKESIFIRE